MLIEMFNHLFNDFLEIASVEPAWGYLVILKCFEIQAAGFSALL